MRRGDHKPPGASAAQTRSAAAYVRALRHCVSLLHITAIIRIIPSMRIVRILRIVRIGHVTRAAITRALGPDRRGRFALVRARGMLALVVLSLALLMAGGASAHIAGMVTETTPTSINAEPTATPSPTPTPEPPLPLSVPPGWQVYRGHHFALAFPAGWTAFEHLVPDASGGVEASSLSFESPDGAQAVGIGEHEGLDAATLKQDCAQPGTHIIYAGLPMITTRTAATLRMFVFVSTSGIAYTLLYREESTPPEVKWLYDSILATFRPEYATSS
jgi:hypothetical protein